MRKATAAAGAAAAVLLSACAAWYGYCGSDWGAWHDFAKRYIQEDGRVIDYAASDRSTSEGQAYALFFALVADDRARFKALLDWTENNLAEGDLNQQLPAWLWGQRDDGSWGVIDPNPASDSDLWLAYTLLHAGRLWQVPAYTEMGENLLDLINAEEVVALPGIGKMLLPAPHGFTSEQGWRLNPSYVPPFMFTYLAQQDPQGPWAEIRDNARALLADASPRGLAPDWYRVDSSGNVRPDPETEARGSYDAIRVYLWNALSSGPTPSSAMAELVQARGEMPEAVDTRTGESRGQAPAGFAGALLPYADRLGREPLKQRLLERLAHADTDHAYYDRVLILFGSGWYDNRYQITEQGRTNPRWNRHCCGILN